MSTSLTRKLIIAISRQLLLIGVMLAIFPAVSGAATPVTPGELPKVTADESSIKTILSIVFGILGSFALLGVVLSGMKYIVSSGDSQKTSEAKNGIIYSLVGLIVAISAEAMVVFVVKRT